MKKVFFIVMAFVTLLMTVGCSTTTTTFPIVYTNNQNTEFEILGIVNLRSNTSVGYDTVFEVAKEQYPETEFVIDIIIDQHEIKTSYHWFAMIFKLIFSANMNQQMIRYEYTIRGTAIKYIRKDARGNIISTPTPVYNLDMTIPNNKNNNNDTVKSDPVESE